MTTSQIKTATQEEADTGIGVIVLAFGSDPAVRWMYPDPHQYLENFPRFAKAFGGRSFEHGSAHYCGAFTSVALWLPPGVQPDGEAVVTLIENSVPAPDRGAVFSIFEQMDGFHPQEPHWYLPLIGTDPLQQGKGCGSALLQHALALCDQQQTPAYLEATNGRGIPFYQRHGFEALGAIQAGTSPPIIPMLRRPKSLSG